MAQFLGLGLGALGGLIGALVPGGGAFAALFGYSIGSMIGGLINQYFFGEETHTKGPRLSDLQNQIS